MPKHILGISCFFHDSAACILRDGEIIAAVQEERFTRKKQDNRFPSHAIAYCLEEAGVTIDAVSRLAFYEKPLLKFERLLDTYLTFAPRGLGSFLTAMPKWLNKQLWVHELLRKEIGFEGEVFFPEHHQSHAAAAFFPSPFSEAAILTVDGVGEWATTTWGTGAGNKIDLKAEIHFPHSLGLLYSAFTSYLGFKVDSDEYKVMGLAPYGEPTYTPVILEHLIDLREDGSFRLDMDYFNYCHGLTMTSAAFDSLFGGPARRPESPFTQRDMDVARSIQAVTEEAMLRLARHVRRRTGARRLCLAGGVALNCVANGAILREGIFDDIWIQPAAGDAGGALGSALFAHYQVLNHTRTADGVSDAQSGSHFGPSFSPGDVERWLTEQGIPHHRCGLDGVIRTAARLIAEGQVVGWFSGRAEFGPRALGARSILGDARSPDMQSVLNQKIKFRESFRPFAPACLEEDADAFFEIGRRSPYMLLTAPVRCERRTKLTPDQEGRRGLQRLRVPRSDIPAVTHVDYSARLQTVGRSADSRFRRLIEEFKQLTGYGIIINTSFNVRDEPIVLTPQDAYRCFMRTGMDALVLENVLLRKEEQPSGRPAAQPLAETLRDLPSSGELRRFGFAMTVLLTVVGGLLMWSGRQLGGGVFVALAITAALTAASVPRVLFRAYRTGRALSERIAKVLTFLLLAGTFCLIVTPLALLARAVSKRFLQLGFDPRVQSYWIPVDSSGPGDRPTNPF